MRIRTFQDAKRAISIDEVLRRLGVSFHQKKHFKCINPSHNDESPSMSIYRRDNIVKCWSSGCGLIEDVTGVVAVVKGVSKGEALDIINEWVNSPSVGTSSYPVESLADKEEETSTNAKFPPSRLMRLANIAHQNLLGATTDDGTPYPVFLASQYGYSIETIKRFKLGMNTPDRSKELVFPNDRHLLIPVIIDGVCHDIRRYNLAHQKGQPKYKAWATGTGRNRFIGSDLIDPNVEFLELYMVSGVSDYLTARQRGLQAIAPTSGEGQINASQLKITGLGEKLGGHLVFYIPDTDHAGQETIKTVVDALGEFGCDCWVIDLSEGGTVPPEKRKDLKDYFFKEGRSLEDFEKLKHKYTNFKGDRNG